MRLVCWPAVAALAESAPAAGRGEGGLEGLGRHPRREAEMLRGTVVLETAQRQEDAVAGHRPSVVVAALDLVPGVVFGRMVTLVDTAADGQGLGEHSFPGEMAGHLVLDAGPDLVAIEDRVVAQVLALRPGAGEQPRLAGPGEPSLRRVGLVLRADVGRPVVSPNGTQRRADGLLGIEMAQPDLMGPALAKQTGRARQPSAY